jgi:hypothetical protein
MHFLVEPTRTGRVLGYEPFARVAPQMLGISLAAEAAPIRGRSLCKTDHRLFLFPRLDLL